jgi:hypothetical protein
VSERKSATKPGTAASSVGCGGVALISDQFDPRRGKAKKLVVTRRYVMLGLPFKEKAKSPQDISRVYKWTCAKCRSLANDSVMKGVKSKDQEVTDFRVWIGNLVRD